VQKASHPVPPSFHTDGNHARDCCPGATRMFRWLILLAVLLVSPLLTAREEPFPSPRQSVARIKVPEGFRVSLVAGEPTLKKPIAATTDERGRLWVVES